MTDKLKTSVSTSSSSKISEPKEEEEIMSQRNLKITSSSWARWDCFTIPQTPDSPSPIVSSNCSDSSELPISHGALTHWPLSMESSTPYNQRSSNINIERSRSARIEGSCSKDSYQKNKQIVRGKSVRTFGKRLSSTSATSSMGKSSELNNPSSSIQSSLNVSDDVPANNRALQIQNEQEEITVDQWSVEGSIASAVGNSDKDKQQSNTDASQPSARNFRNFISGIKRGKVGMKLKDRLRKKEASIEERGMKEIARASADLNEIKAGEGKTGGHVEEKIENTWRKDQLKKEKEGRSTATKTTKVSRAVKKISVIVKLSWWRSLFNRSA